MSDKRRDPQHGLRQAFAFAFDGLRYAIGTQRTFRIHLAIAVVVAALALWLPLPAVQAALVILAVAIVLAAELFNTGVEAIVDLLVEENHHDLARIAKDIAAAAVLMTAVAAAVVGVLILAPPLAAVMGIPSAGGVLISRLVAAGLLLGGAIGTVRLWRDRTEDRLRAKPDRRASIEVPSAIDRR